jgi:hypothetical protein
MVHPRLWGSPPRPWKSWSRMIRSGTLLIQKGTTLPICRRGYRSKATRPRITGLQSRATLSFFGEGRTC